MDLEEKLEKLNKIQEITRKLNENIKSLENNINQNQNINSYNNYLFKQKNNSNTNNNNNNNDDNSNQNNELRAKQIKQKILDLKRFEKNILDDLKESNNERLLEIQKAEENQNLLDETLELCNSNISNLDNEDYLEEQISNTNNSKIKNYLKLSKDNENINEYTKNLNRKKNNNDVGNNKNNPNNEKNENTLKNNNKIVNHNKIEKNDNMDNYKLVNSYLNDLETEKLFQDNIKNFKKINFDGQTNNKNKEELNIDSDTEETIEDFINDCHTTNCEIIDTYLNLANENNLITPDEKKLKSIKSKLDGYIFIPQNEICNLYKSNYIKYIHINDNSIVIKYGFVIKITEKGILLTDNRHRRFWYVSKKCPIFKKISPQDIREIVENL